MIVNRTGALLGERHLKAIDLARGAGINYNTAHGLYSGRTTRFDADVLDKVCEFLDVQVGDILVYVPNGTDEPESQHNRSSNVHRHTANKDAAEDSELTAKSA